MDMIKNWQSIYLSSKCHVVPHARRSMMKLKNKNIAKFTQHIQFKDAWDKTIYKVGFWSGLIAFVATVAFNIA